MDKNEVDEGTMGEQHIQYTHIMFLNDYAKWVNDQEMVRLSEPVAAIQEVLASGSLSRSQRVEIATDMGWIGPYCCGKGAVLCFSAPLQGWKLMKRGLLYKYWNQRISARARDFWEPNPEREDDSFAQATGLTELAAMGMAIARPEALWTLDAMERGLADGSVSWFCDDFFAAYMVRLYRRLKGEEDIKDIPPNATEWEHPFDDLIDNWDDEEMLADSIRAMCDYHLYWNHEETDEHDGEFSAPYAMVNPIEIHALEAVRRELGLTTPKVEHELLQPPFYPLPDFAERISTEEILEEDDLLRRIIEVNRPWCDGLED